MPGRSTIAGRQCHPGSGTTRVEPHSAQWRVWRSNPIRIGQSTPGHSNICADSCRPTRDTNRVCAVGEATWG